MDQTKVYNSNNVFVFKKKYRQVFGISQNPSQLIFTDGFGDDDEESLNLDAFGEQNSNSGVFASNYVFGTGRSSVHCGNFTRYVFADGWSRQVHCAVTL